MLFIRLSCPANDIVPPSCGVSRPTDCSRPSMVGRLASASRATVVAAPVRPELKITSDSARTVISSFTVATLSVNSTSVLTPSVTSRFAFSPDRTRSTSP